MNLRILLTFRLLFHQRLIPDGCGTTIAWCPFQSVHLKYSGLMPSTLAAAFPHTTIRSNSSLSSRTFIAATALAISNRSPLPLGIFPCHAPSKLNGRKKS